MSSSAVPKKRAHRLPTRLASAAMAVVMLATLTEAMPPPPSWMREDAPDVQDFGPAVTGTDAKVEPRQTGQEHEAAVTEPADVSWPAADTATITVGGQPRHGRGFSPNGGAVSVPAQAPEPVAVGGLPVTVRPAPQSPAAVEAPLAPAPATAPRTVDIRVLDQAAARAAGVKGLLLHVTRADGGTRPGDVDLTVDYSAFADAYGGDYGARLTLVRLPACAAFSPETPACARTEQVPASNDAGERTVTARVLADPAATAAPSPLTASATGAPAVYALAASGSSSQGSYSATQLSPSSSWDTSLSSGEFSWNHPIEVPGVPGELEPAIDLAYSSQTVDGRTTTTNNQGSWIGEGFSYEPGYIERSYKACADDGHKTLGDQCWGTDNATLMLGSSSGELVKDDTTGEWRLKSDDGSKIERLTGAVNGDDDGEYWRVTTVEGIKYYFGFNRLPGWSSGKEETDSAWTVPVFGDDSGEPCHKSTLSESWCQQAWRWNLDYVEDRHGNTMSFFYAKETNHYAREAKTDRNGTSYTRGGYLKRIDYGQRANQVYDDPAPARVVFTVAERCLTTDTFDCAADKLTAANAAHWPDVPFDLHCKAGTKCSWSQTAPSYWTRKRLTKVTTQVSDGNGYTDVDSFNLKHLFTDNGDGSKTLWLSEITETGHVGGEQSLPSIQLNGIQLPNRIDKPGDHISPLNRFRLSTVYTETGGQITVNYTGGECTPTTLPTPGNSTGRCYPVKWSPPGAEDPITDWFHKYVVTELIEEDRTGGAPEEYTRYEYLGDAGWRHDDADGLTDPKHQTWGQWRGYAKVRVRTGDGQTMPGRTEHTFLRGLHGDKKPGGGTRTVTVADSTGTEHTDHDDLAGFELEEAVYNGSDIIEKDINVPWRHHTATRVKSWGTTRATFLNTGTERSFTALASGGWQETKSTTSYDTATGRETMVHDHGDVSVPGDDQCTRTSYADNTAAGMRTYVSRVETVAVGCSTTPDRATDVLSDVRKHYDGQGFGAAPTKGDVTTVEKLISHDGTTPTYLTVEGVSYDSFGRAVEVRDGDGQVTETVAYTDTNGLTTAIVGTNALGHTTTMELAPERGIPLVEIDANDRRIDLAYDPLGRLTQVWHPDRSKSRGFSPNQRFEYHISENAPVAVKSEDLRNDGSYEAVYEIYDSFLRPRQVQTRGPDGGRLVTDVFYNALGETAKTNDVYYAVGAPSGTLLIVDNGDVNGQTVYEYDGAGRPTAVIQRVSGDEKWRSTASYGGDRVHVTPPDGGIPTTVITDARGQEIEKRQYKGDTPTGDYDATTYAYTPAGLLESVTSPSGQTWSSRYDQRGRRIEATAPDAGTTTFTYNDFDQLISTTDARGSTVSRVYDQLGRVTETYEGTPDTGTKLTSWEYDTRLKGQLYMESRYHDGEQYRIAVTQRDSLYRPLTTVYGIPASHGGLAGNYTFTTGYNLDGTVAGTSMPAGGGMTSESLIYGYDDLQRTTTIWSNLGTYVTRTNYAQTGEPLQYELSTGGPKTWLTYDWEKGTGRLVRSRATRQGPGDVALDVRYGYDDAGSIHWVSDTPTSGETETQCFEYDYLLRLTQAWTTGTAGDGVCADEPTAQTVGGPQPYWHSFSYDLSGNRLTETIHNTGPLPEPPAATSTEPEPSTEPTPTAQSIPTTPSSQGSSPSPSLSPLTPAPSAEPSQTVPDAPEAVPAPAPGEAPEPRPIQRMMPDAGEAEPEAEDQEEPQTEPEESEEAEELGQVAAESDDPTATGDVVRTYDYPENQPHTLTQVVEQTPDGDRLYSYEYDEVGNTVKRTIAGDEQTLTWSAEGSLASVTTAEGTTSFVYTPTGERLIRTDPDGATLYLPGMELRAENGTVKGTRYYVHNGETIAVRTVDDGVTFLAADHHGTAQLAVNATTGDAERRRFTPFGEERGEPNAAWPDDKGFLGKVVDASTGLSHLGAREYDPTIGRFISADPILDFSDPQQLNGYIYANNSPMTFADPSGLLWKKITKAAKKVKKKAKAAVKKTKKVVKKAVKKTTKFVKKHKNTIISVGAGVVVGAACSALTAGAGTAGCAILGGAVSGWVGYMLSTPRNNRTFGGMLGATALGGAFGWAGGAIGGRVAGALASRAAPWLRSVASRVRPAATPRPPVRPPTRPAPAAKPNAGAASSARPGAGRPGAGRSGVGAKCSFVPATPVLLADGTTAPIAALAVGASVVAADPVTGEAGDREVVATHISTGVKQLVEVTVNPASEKQPNPLGAPVDQSGDANTDSGEGNAAFDADGPVVATGNHEFWVADLGQWLAAGALAPGMWLQTSAGTWVQISAIRSWTASDQTVHNLTVHGIHTYHVGVGTTPVLTHNCNPAQAAVAELRASGSVGRSKNIAAAEVFLEGQAPYMLRSVSGDALRPGTVTGVGGPGNPQRFIPTATGMNNRFSDTEFKLLNSIANQLGPSSGSVRGVVNLHSELPVCVSCSSVMSQFRASFPGVILNVTTG